MRTDRLHSGRGNGDTQWEMVLVKDTSMGPHDARKHLTW